jgi:hypothetical protein
MNTNKQLKQIQSILNSKSGDKKSKKSGRSRSRSRSRSRTPKGRKVTTSRRSKSVNHMLHFEKHKAMLIPVLKKLASQKTLLARTNVPEVNMSYYGNPIRKRMVDDPEHKKFMEAWVKENPGKLKLGDKVLQKEQWFDEKSNLWVWSDDRKPPADPLSPEVKVLTDENKALTLEVQNLVKEVGLVTSAFKAGIGNKPISMILHSPFDILTTVTTGVTNTVQFTIASGGATIQLRDTAEYSLIAALFDEAKIESGTMHFNYLNPVIMGTIPTGNNNVTNNNIPIICYDPSDATAGTSTLALMEQAQHELLSCPHTFSGAASATNVYQVTHARHKFHFRVPSGIALDGSSTVEGAWIQIGNGGVVSGGIKFYHVGSVITASTTGSGTMFLKVALRCRS